MSTDKTILPASVARLVHFYTQAKGVQGPQGAGPYAAMVTNVRTKDGLVLDLHVFTPSGLEAQAVPHQTHPQAGDGDYWVWPPRV